jgi:hypothetical protein
MVAFYFGRDGQITRCRACRRNPPATARLRTNVAGSGGSPPGTDTPFRKDVRER